MTQVKNLYTQKGVLLLNNDIVESDITNLKYLGKNNIIINCKFVGDGIRIENNCTLKNCVVAENTIITDSYLEDSLIGKNCNHY